MKHTSLRNYKNIIRDLSELRSVKPTPAFRSRLEQIVFASLPQEKYLYNKYLLPYSFRVLTLTFILLLFSGLGIVSASQNAIPGSVLYPVRQLVLDTKIYFTSDSGEKAILNLEKSENKIEEIKTSVSVGNDEKLENAINAYKQTIDEVAKETKSFNEKNSETTDNIVNSLGRQEQTLQEIKNIVPENRKPAINNAINSRDNAARQVEEAVGNPENNSGNTQVKSIETQPANPEKSNENKLNNYERR